MLRKLVPIAVVLGCLGTSALALPARVPLAVAVNGQSKPDVWGWISEEGLWIAASDAKSWGLATVSDSMQDGREAISLKGFGDQVTFDENELKLTVTLAAAEIKGRTTVNLLPRSTNSDKAAVADGLLFSYMMGLGQFGGTTSVDGALETLASWRGWQFLDSRSAALYKGALQAGYRSTTVRRDWQEKNLRLDIGALALPDAGLASWGGWHGVGLSSMRVGYNALQATRASASFSTLVQFPSTADVYVNGVKQGSYAVAPGVFDLQGLRGYANGATQVKAVIRDIFGNESVVEERRYLTDTALAAGVGEFSYQMGYEDYLTESDLQLRAVHRYGFNDTVTGTARGDVRKGYAAGQLGAVAHFAGWGEFGANVLAGRSAQGPSPKGFELSHQYLAQSWSTRTGLTSRPVLVTTLEGGLATRQVRELSIQANYGSRTGGQFSARASILRQEAGRDHLVSELGWSRNLTEALFTQVYFRGDSVAGPSVQLMLVYRPGSGRTINTYTDASVGHLTQQVSISQQAESPDASSWLVESKSQGGAVSSSAFVDKPMTAGVLRANAYMAGNQASGRVTWQGAAVVSEGGVSVLAHRSDAALLIDAAGLAGVGVFRNGTREGTTDSQGYFMMGNLTGYEEVRVSLNESDIPLNYWYAGAGTVPIRPSTGSVVPVRFDIRKLRTAQITVKVCSPSGCKVPVDQVLVIESEGGVLTRGNLKRGQASVEGLLTGRHHLRTVDGACVGEIDVALTGPVAATLECLKERENR